VRGDEVLLPAVVRVRLAGPPVRPEVVEAVLTRTLADIGPSVVPEVVWVPVLSRADKQRPELTYALVLELGGDGGDAEKRLLRRMERSVRKAVRREFGRCCEVAVRLAREQGEVATCFRAMVGNPRDAGP